MLYKCTECYTNRPTTSPNLIPLKFVELKYFTSSTFSSESLLTMTMRSYCHENKWYCVLFFMFYWFTFFFSNICIRKIYDAPLCLCLHILFSLPFFPLSFCHHFCLPPWWLKCLFVPFFPSFSSPSPPLCDAIPLKTVLPACVQWNEMFMVVFDGSPRLSI